MKNYIKTLKDRAKFSCLLRHPAGKWNGSTHTALEATRGSLGSGVQPYHRQWGLKYRRL